jgi:Arc/MetJ family transcription regulator
VTIESEATDVFAHLHQSSILMHMRTTLNLDDDLIRTAREFTGIQEKTALIHKALRDLVAAEAGRRLVALGGTMPDFEPGRRSRPARSR